jgi:hypothetical protein
MLIIGREEYMIDREMKQRKAKASSVSKVLSKAGFSGSKKEGALFTDGFLCDQFGDAVRVDHCVYYKNYLDSEHINEIFDSYLEVLTDYYDVEPIFTLSGDVRCLVVKEFGRKL